MSIPHSTQKDEIRGDWSVLKGTEYHLIYALWLIFCERAIDVAFYEGNDLRARPSPPAASNSDDTLPLVAMRSRSSGEEDLWIQLKSTDRTWTLSQFLPSETAEDNLLVNFICNAAQSERQGRRWRACLITPARVNGKELDEFVTAPANNSRYHQRLLNVVARAHKRLENEVSQPAFDKNYLEGLGLEVLRQLAQTVPTSQELLKAQVEIELAYLLPDRGAVHQAANTLLGALLTDAARKPAPGRRYDVDWVNETAGLNLHSYDLFDRDPVVACGEVVKQNLPRDWDPRRFIPRGRLQRALELFLRSPETVFVLVGASGTGKSWAMADWMTGVLTSQARLLATGVALETHQNLPALAGRYLRQYTAVGGWTDEYILRRLAASARVNGRGPLVVVIDDLLISQSTSAHFGRNLAEIVERCREYDIKLVLTCQLHVWELYGLGRAIPSGDIFSPSDGFALKPVAKTSENPYSFLLTDLTHDELRQALQRWVPEERANRAALLLRAPAFAALRNPYLLTRYMEQHGGELGVLNKDPAPLVIDNLLDTRVQTSLERVALAMSLNVDDVRPAFDSLIGLFWIKRTVGVSYKEAADCINQYLTGQSQTVIAEMRRVGLLSTEGGIGLSEPRVAERLFAKLVGARMFEDARVLAELSPEVDSEVVAALLRGVASDPVVCAEQLLQRDARWVSAVAAGLGHCSPADERVVMLLMALARPDNNRILVREAGEALSQIASRGKRAWKRVAEMYLDIWRPLESYRGAYALGAAMEFAPRWAGTAVRLRLSKAAKIRGKSPEDQKKRQRLLKGALEPLRDIKHEEAARIAKRLVSLYSPLGGRNERDSDYDFLEHLDHARSGIALYGGAGELSTLLEELHSDDRLLRYRAACAMRGIAIDQPQLIQDELIAAIATEKYAKITNRLLLAAYHLIKTSPELILRTLQLNLSLKVHSPQLAAELYYANQ